MLQGFRKQRQSAADKKKKGHDDGSGKEEEAAASSDHHQRPMDVGDLDRLYRASLPVLTGGPMAWMAKKRAASFRDDEEVFERCALVRVKKDDARCDEDDDDGMAEDEEERAKGNAADEGEIPMLIRLNMARVGKKKIKVRDADADAMSWLPTVY